MVFNSIFNNNSAISWWSILFVDETGVSGENQRPVANTDKFYHITLYRVHLTTLVVIGTDYMGSFTSKYSTTTTTP